MQVRKLEIILDIVEVAKKAKCKVAELTYGDYETYGKFNPSTVSRWLGSWTAARRAAAKANPAKIAADLRAYQQEEAREEKKAQIVSKYVEILSTTGQTPTTSDMAQAGISRDSIARAFGGLSVLESQIRDESPELFKDVKLHSLFSPKAFADLAAAVKNKKRFVITTAVMDCSVHEGFIASLKQWCAANDGELLVMVSFDPAHNRDTGHRNENGKEIQGKIDAKLAQERVVLKDTSLNNNLKLSVLKTAAKMIDPMTGIKRLVQRNGNLIVASPKQRQIVVPVPSFKLPHVGMSTGACTISNYNTHYYNSERLAYIAENDHVIGALIVELENDELFHYRQVQADTDGSFYDIAGMKLNKYTPTQVKAIDLRRNGASALVMGDWHSGETDPVAAAAWMELSKIVSPEYLVVHDGFNGLSINHHEEHDSIVKAQRARDNQLNLEAELRGFAADLDMLSPYARKEVVVVKSNHDEFLIRYLKEGMYVKDPQNHRFSLKLAEVAIDDGDPLQYAVEEVVGLEKTTNVRFLKRNEDFKIARIQLGAHGDKGPNGSRGTLANQEESYGFCVTGHSHVPMILRGAWSVGTTSYLKLGYNEDNPSSWMQTSCIVYPNGQRQLINCIFGKFMLGSPDVSVAA